MSALLGDREGRRAVPASPALTEALRHHCTLRGFREQNTDTDGCSYVCQLLLEQPRGVSEGQKNHRHSENNTMSVSWEHLRECPGQKADWKTNLHGRRRLRARLHSPVPLAGTFPPVHPAGLGGEPELFCAAPLRKLLCSAGLGPATSQPMQSSLSAPDRRHVYTATELLPFLFFILIPAAFRNLKEKGTFLVNKVEKLKQLTLPYSLSNCSSPLSCAFDIDGCCVEGTMLFEKYSF